MPKSDVVIIGSGLAALVTASRLCTTKNVIVFTKASKFNSNSILAQGGIASVVHKEDDWYSHFQDTMKAGCYYGDMNAVEQLVKTGPHYIKELINKGMLFDQDGNGNLLVGQEGAHTHRRILHAGGDATGKGLVAFLYEQIKNEIEIVEHHMAIELVIDDGICIGVRALDENDKFVTFFAEHVILATGGCGAIYKYTSNDSTVVGDGYAMAYRAGADLVDMEFVQFHPTLLKTSSSTPGLISEAVRGEGAVLRREDGSRVMEDIHPLLDLAPRDVVSRAIYNEMKSGEDIYLDISMIQNFSERFPTIASLCSEHHISIEKGRIPIVPGAHFMMGGIKVNNHCESSIPGLYAVGEVACTGVHGANRLASNSLLEGLVFANKLADYIITHSIRGASFRVTYSQIEGKNNCPDMALITKETIQELLMKHVGIVRNREGLSYVIEQFEPYVTPRKDLTKLSKEEVTKLNMITNAWLIASSALRREESRGGHFRKDIPETKPDWDHKKILRNNYEQVLFP